MKVHLRGEISYEKERLNTLRTEAEIENQKISWLQYELEVKRKALAIARSWAEDEAKRAREQAKVLEEARDRWESTKSIAENLVDKLKIMAKWRQIKAVNHVGEVKDGAVSVSIVNGSMQELQRSSAVLSSAVKEGVKRVVGDEGHEDSSVQGFCVQKAEPPPFFLLLCFIGTMMFSGSIQVDDFVAHVITKGIPRYLSQGLCEEVQLPRKLSYKLGRSLFNKADAGKDQKNDDDFVATEYLNEYSRQNRLFKKEKEAR
ncbi:hypothetical protein Tco_0832709 [Tanacetum coccineum]